MFEIEILLILLTIAAFFGVARLGSIIRQQKKILEHLENLSSNVYTSARSLESMQKSYSQQLTAPPPLPGIER